MESETNDAANDSAIDAAVDSERAAKFGFLWAAALFTYCSLHPSAHRRCEPGSPAGHLA
jgi:hypothetical protein